jgi:hypothetical protein
MKKYCLPSVLMGLLLTTGIMAPNPNRLLADCVVAGTNVICRNNAQMFAITCPVITSYFTNYPSPPGGSAWVSVTNNVTVNYRAAENWTKPWHRSITNGETGVNLTVASGNCGGQAQVVNPTTGEISTDYTNASACSINDKGSAPCIKPPGTLPSSINPCTDCTNTASFRMLSPDKVADQENSGPTHVAQLWCTSNSQLNAFSQQISLSWLSSNSCDLAVRESANIYEQFSEMFSFRPAHVSSCVARLRIHISTLHSQKFNQEG